MQYGGEGMKMKRYAVYVWMFLVLLVVDAHGFSLPEILEYDLAIADIKIGSLSLQASDNGQYVQLQSKSTAVKWVSLFYGVDDDGVTLLRKSQMKELPRDFGFLPFSAKVTINEGPNKARKEFAFDYAKKVVTYSDILTQERATFALKDATFDALSGLYYMRHVPLKAGTSVFLHIFNNKVVYRVEVQVLRREALKTSLGTVNTVVVRTNMDGVGDGIIYYPGDITMWLTDDDTRVPVMIEKTLKPLIEGNLPDFVKKGMPDFLMKKVSTGVIRAVLVKK
jgi:hypothetical protein